MANPFGQVVDNEKLDTMIEYEGKPKTQRDRARVAMLNQNDNGKNTQASTYASQLREYEGERKCVECLFYNGTGEPLTLADYREWNGLCGRTPFPTSIGNGQWAAFCHFHDSEVAVVYRGKNGAGGNRDYILAFRRGGVLVDVDNVNRFPSRADTIRANLNKSGRNVIIRKDNCVMEGSIGSGGTPRFIASVYIPY